jgi:U4/U6 small nuclear ribonucleoprotein PRP31
MADALLDDLDDLSDIDPEENTHRDDAEDEDEPEHPLDPRTHQRPRLLDDPTLQSHLASISTAQDSKPPANNSTIKDAEYAEHMLILSSNKHLVSLGQEIHRTHLDLCRLYHVKFPELEELLTDPFQYRAAVEIIGNEMDVTVVNDRLNEVLTSNQIITISVAGSTTSGRVLTPDEMKEVQSTCRYLDELKETKESLTSFVESRMERWAPNICALIGSSLSAKLLASTGGLSELSKIPACNLQLLGKVKNTSMARGGMATTSRSHAGYLMECDLVSELPNYLKMRAVKAVAGKLALAARTDHVNVETGRRRTNEVGRKFHEELREKFGKWEEPDKAQVVKALPK